MNYFKVNKTSFITKYRYIAVTLFPFLMSACGGSSTPTIADPSVPISKKPINRVSHAYFLDQDGETGKISGQVTIQTSTIIEGDTDQTDSVWVYWANAQGEKFGGAWLKTSIDNTYKVEIPKNTVVPDGISALLLYPTNAVGQAVNGTLLNFLDFSGNTALSGLGGNEINHWEYGSQRPKIYINRSSLQNPLCTFDNGLVSVTNMNNTKDLTKQIASERIQSNEVDDKAFPAYSFLCDEQPIHNSDHITDEVGVWTYSTMNDAMFYGTSVYNMFVKYLGEPPLNEKVRLRVHYGDLIDSDAFWDGAYANFTDAYPLFYSTASLDIIAHEVAHGVLGRISPLNIFKEEISIDAKTLHEAFSDISGVIAKYEFTGSSDNWTHGEESHGPTRQLNKIETEIGAIASFLDYDNAGDNYYLRTGMITYPFYLLSEKWGVELTYKVYINAAKHCWPTTVTLPQAAQCIQQQAVNMALPEKEVISAFKAVKIQLFEQGTLSHFLAETFKLNVKFTDNSQTTSQVTQWLWDFGDGHTSNEQNPEHNYTEAGTYQVKLTVIDQAINQEHSQDSFERTINVTDQYCEIRSLDTDNKITNVIINNTDINFNSTKADYTHTTVKLNGDKKLIIDINGDTQSTLKSNSWKVWIDLNDNGIFGDQNEELIFNEVIGKEQPYALQTSIDLSLLPNDGIAKHMRISGDYSVITTPCESNIGEAFDLKVNW